MLQAGTKQTQTEIGPIACDWELTDLATIAEPPQYGFTATASETGNTRFLRITDIEDWRINWSSVPYCTCPEEKLEKYLLRSGDIVFARIGATTGKSTLVTNPPNAVFASYLIRVRTKARINACFLSHFFQSHGYWRQIEANKNANLKKGVSGSVLKTLLVPIPPLPEQRRIAAVLSLVQRAIEEQERLIALTTELKKALMHKLFTEGTRGEPQKQTEIGPIPESWEVVELQTTGDVVYGIQASVANNFEPVGTKILTNKNIALDGGFALDKINYFELKTKRHYQTLLKPGDLLFNWRSGSKEHVGKNVLPTAKPSREEQNDIAARIDAVIQLEDVAGRKRDVMTDLFRTLLHQLMTAEIRVNHLDLAELGLEMGSNDT